MIEKNFRREGAFLQPTGNYQRCKENRKIDLKPNSCFRFFISCAAGSCSRHTSTTLLLLCMHEPCETHIWHTFYSNTSAIFQLQERYTRFKKYPLLSLV